VTLPSGRVRRTPLKLAARCGDGAIMGLLTDATADRVPHEPPSAPGSKATLALQRKRPEEARFFTTADAGFYPGTVALLNSLRLTGHAHELVILDVGLADHQRRALAPHATLVDPPPEDRHAITFKPYPALAQSGGVAVVIDSDIMVTGSLEPILALARDGRICAFPDPPWSRGRWFAEWRELLGLERAPRRQPYVNAGFVAVSTDHWPGLLARWWELCGRVPPDRAFAGDVLAEPLYATDQDILNAILMSEIPAEAVAILPEYATHKQRVIVRDERTLTCTFDGAPQPLLHEALRPKVWQRSGWRRVRLNAYVRLLPRVLFGNDVTLRIEPREVPFWLRPGRVPRLVMRALHISTRAQDAATRARRAPRRVRRELRRAVRRPRASSAE
jgi:hypothetical protein